MTTQGNDATTMAACTPFLRKISTKMTEVLHDETSISSLRSNLQVRAVDWVYSYKTSIALTLAYIV